MNPMFLNLQLPEVPMQSSLRKVEIEDRDNEDEFQQKALSSVARFACLPSTSNTASPPIVESIEQQKASQRAHLAELDTLFASLQSRAFRGDL